ncbi:hypothetical protein [Streptomyces sp. NPDC060184]|uniref:hypothetical protein n=1 Tax=Streptomyces sp. NPDC060184 TaxID=3347064 RepID=UPI00366A26AE
MARRALVGSLLFSVVATSLVAIESFYEDGMPLDAGSDRVPVIAFCLLIGFLGFLLIAGYSGFRHVQEIKKAGFPVDLAHVSMKSEEEFGLDLPADRACDAARNGLASLDGLRLRDGGTTERQDLRAVRRIGPEFAEETYRQVVSVRIRPAAAGTSRVTVRSRARFRLSLFDHGRSRQHLAEVVAAIRSHAAGS